MTAPTTTHIVLNGPPEWGHLGGLCALAAKIAVERAAVVTLLIPNTLNVHGLGENEVQRSFAVVDTASGVARVVGFGDAYVPNESTVAAADGDAFMKVWEVLMNEQPIACSVTGKMHPAVAKPTLVILDAVQNALFPLIRSFTSATPAPSIYAWQFGAAAGLAVTGIFSSTPENAERDPLVRAYSDEEKLHGRQLPVTGRIIDSPGLPRMYDWELFSYVLPITGSGGKLTYITHLYYKSLLESDGIVTACSPALDGDVLLRQFDAWAASRGVPTFHVGPLQPLRAGTFDFSPETTSTELAMSGSEGANAILKLLNSAPERNVVYISFGSLFWPASNLEHLWTAIEMLISTGKKFILAHPSPLAVIPEDIKSRFSVGGSESDKGLVLPWAPQQAILAHKSVGWFLTHGGAGGILDAMTQGVPLIGWPLMGDEAANIAQMAHTADVAFELVEVRMGKLGLRPMLTAGKTPTGTLDAFKAEFAGVLDRVDGAEGARKRANAMRIRNGLTKAWTEGGSARTAFDALMGKFGV